MHCKYYLTIYLNALKNLKSKNGTSWFSILISRGAETASSAENIVTCNMSVLKYIYPIILLAFMLASCSKDEDEVVVEKRHSTYVLVHGAWQSSFVWDKVKKA